MCKRIHDIGGVFLFLCLYIINERDYGIFFIVEVCVKNDDAGAEGIVYTSLGRKKFDQNNRSIEQFENHPFRDP